MSRRTRSTGVAVLAALLAASPVAAQEPVEPGVRDRAEQAVKEGVEKILHALEILIGSVPQYEMPEVQPNGDILIRRKRPEPETAPKPPPSGPDGKST